MDGVIDNFAALCSDWTGGGVLDLVESGLLVLEECTTRSGDICNVGCGIVLSKISALNKVENVRFASSAAL